MKKQPHNKSSKPQSRPYPAKGSAHKKPTGKPGPSSRQTTSRQAKPKPKAPAHKGPLLWGLHAVREALLNPARTCHHLWVSKNGAEALLPTLEKAKKQGRTLPDPTLIEKSEIDQLLPQGTVHQGIVLETSPLEEMSLDDLLGRDDLPEVIVVLDQVTDPHNVGAILRSAAAFGAGAVIVTERNAPSATGVLAKTACGALEHVPLIPVVNLARTLDILKEESYWCIGLAEEGEHDLAQSKLTDGRVALVLGAEGDGLRRLTRQHCDELARLPTQGPIGSLNVSNAAAISFYEATRQKRSLE
ncbi:MAG: 23S rRNA (guanosine(2251)-2'-O)-methyltransferase RlmB [Bdellovibrionales bacterium]